MKIGVISDIHIDRNRDYPILELLAEKVKEKQLGWLLIAGDISDTQSVTLSFIDELQALAGIPVCFVPGNHDLWCRVGERPDETWEIYRRYQEHPACLIDKVVSLTQDWVVLGDIGWYDYSFGNTRFKEDFINKSMFNRTWQDSVLINWRQPDAEIHHNMLERLGKQLAATLDKNRIVVTHMVTTYEFVVPESRAEWTYFNAFLGSRDYGEQFEKYSVRYSIMGHVHYRRQLVKNGVSYVCSCLNYNSEWKSADCGKEIDDALLVIELQ